jgi:DNA repair exonuclease SbcCD nuclease subunit
MNNFVFSGSDPLLYNTMASNVQRQMPPEMDVRQQLDNALAQYQQAQQNLLAKQPPQQPEKEQKDYLGELDEMVKELDEEVMGRLQVNEEFITLNAEIQQMIQNEIMKSVRWKINSNPEAISKIETLKKTIKTAQKEQQAEEKRSMMELNDYITNYSSMSFDDYKRIKALK